MEFCARLALAGDLDAVWQGLYAGYAEPSRAYHNLAHIDDCLRRLDEDAADARDIETRLRDEIEAALWFHDVIYVVGASDNEARSAGLARASLSSLGASTAFVDRVAALIQATDHKHAGADEAERLICDIDLSILGREPHEYDRYADAILREVGLPEAEFAPHRHRFLESMVARERIFQTDRFHHLYHAAARANMHREAARWAGLRTL